jgi:hypothetical protein
MPARHGKCGVIRFRFIWDCVRRRVRIEPDEADLIAASNENLAGFWSAVGWWSESFMASYPDWSVNGCVCGVEQESALEI